MDTLLERLKIDLGIINSTAYDSRLTVLLDVAKKEIEKEGAPVDLEDVSDCELVIDYARYLWLSRREPMTEPRSLRWRINNRIFGKKVDRNG